MNTTPATVARQIVTARAQRAHRPVFTSETGVVRPTRVPRPGHSPVVENDPHCFVCGRHTDHWGEHDDMVSAGTARYENDGSVYPVPWRWDA